MCCDVKSNLHGNAKHEQKNKNGKSEKGTTNE